MFAYIKGVLAEKGENYVVIDVMGIGYRVFMPNSSINKVGELDEQVKVHTYYYVREDNIKLYGFLNNDERKMFELLLSISGVGAKSAITMISEIRPSDFALAVITNDVSKLVKIPGVGKKTAERLIVELKDKLKTETSIREEENSQSSYENLDATKEAISALQVLGYNTKEIEKAIEKLDTKNMTVEDIIRKILNLLSK